MWSSYRDAIVHDRRVFIEHIHGIHLLVCVSLEPDPQVGLDVVVEDVDVSIPIRELVLVDQADCMSYFMQIKSLLQQHRQKSSIKNYA